MITSWQRCNGRTQLPEVTCGPPDKAEQQCGADKGPAPHVDVLYGGHTQEDENQRFTHAAPHFQEVLDADVAVLGHISLNILFHGDGTRHNTTGTKRN